MHEIQSLQRAAVDSTRTSAFKTAPIMVLVVELSAYRKLFLRHSTISAACVSKRLILLGRLDAFAYGSGYWSLDDEKSIFKISLGTVDLLVPLFH